MREIVTYHLGDSAVSGLTNRILPDPIYIELLHRRSSRVPSPRRAYRAPFNDLCVREPSGTTVKSLLNESILVMTRNPHSKGLCGYHGRPNEFKVGTEHEYRTSAVDLIVSHTIHVTG